MNYYPRTCGFKNGYTHSVASLRKSKFKMEGNVTNIKTKNIFLKNNLFIFFEYFRTIHKNALKGLKPEL
jgi:hypothetical protein